MIVYVFSESLNCTIGGNDGEVMECRFQRFFNRLYRLIVGNCCIHPQLCQMGGATATLSIILYNNTRTRVYWVVFSRSASEGFEVLASASSASGDWDFMEEGIVASSETNLELFDFLVLVPHSHSYTKRRKEHGTERWTGNKWTLLRNFSAKPQADRIHTPVSPFPQLCHGETADFAPFLFPILKLNRTVF